MNSIARALSLLLCTACLLRAQAPSASELPALAAAALAGDTNAIGKLRAAGPPGLEAVFEAGKDGITALRQNQSRLEAPENAKLRAALDGVARQRDAYASGLYWFTDLDAAKAEARKTGRPILSLRLLGNLDDEFSCANSRFFRTSLYANRTVSALLRRGYVLHWKSVRPVPVLTIDMGDGRRIKRTITGNSIHYILNADGHVLDALPGNYGPAAFITALQRIELKTQDKKPPQLRQWHGHEANALCHEWLVDALQAGIYGDAAKAALEEPDKAEKLFTGLFPKAFPASSGQSRKLSAEKVKELLPSQGFPVVPTTPVMPGHPGGLPLSRFGGELVLQMMKKEQREQTNAEIASIPLVGRLFRTKIETIKEFQYPTEFDPPKGMVERPILKQSPAPAADAALDLAAPGADGASLTLAQRMTNEQWAKLAAEHRSAVILDEASRRFMMAKLPADMTAPLELEVETRQTPLYRILANFESAIARDMVRNEYYFHTLIHQWLEEDKDGTLTRDVEALNKRVYAELFLTPDYDEWLGLVPEDTYTALEKDGCACDKGAPPMRTTKTAR